MYAMIEACGKQYKVEKGETVFFEKLDVEEGKKVTFDKVMLVSDDKEVKVGNPYVKGVKVEGKVVSHGKGKKIVGPIIFQGGVSKNVGVKKAFSELLGEEIIVSEFGHLMGAIGVALLAARSNKRTNFSFHFDINEFETKGIECHRCPNHCEIISVRHGKKIIDSWGNRCEKGELKIES